MHAALGMLDPLGHGVAFERIHTRNQNREAGDTGTHT